jgi:hypothetical protein
MLLELVLVLLILVVSAYDVQVSARRLQLYGQASELNPLAVWLVGKFGPKTAIAISVFAPSLAIASAFFGLQFKLGLAAFAGYKLAVFHMQLASRHAEEKLKEILARKLAPVTPPTVRRSE